MRNNPHVYAEMESICQAFMAKWGKVPLLDTYRQMAIRQQKKRDWEACKWWAERGLALYGQRAAREEAVEDLIKCRNRAMAKLEAAAIPRRQGKLRNDRYVPLHPELVKLLATWTAANLEHIRRHKRLAADHRGPLDGTGVLPRGRDHLASWVIMVVSVLWVDDTPPSCPWLMAGF